MKCYVKHVAAEYQRVTLHVRVWIEVACTVRYCDKYACHPLCEDVD